MKSSTLRHLAGALVVGGLVALCGAVTPNQDSALAQASKTAEPAKGPELQPLPEVKFNADQAELGRYLFFDVRLSGDAALSCATCHSPAKGWGDGRALSRGYPASEYFRNAPTVVNAVLKKRFMWDGRLDGSDLGTLVRDMITESPLMNMDSRLMQERLKQVPEYVAMWQKFRKDDINGMRVYGVVAEFLKTLVSKNAPIDRFLKGDATALSAEAKQGYDLFKGKANCISCHNGPVASDGNLHRTGVPENPAVTAEPLRHITMLRHYSTSGMPNYMSARTDVGYYAISKDPKDIGKFATPSLRDLKYTAPYMHNGMFSTLDEVINFYDNGGGQGSELKPLGLSVQEKAALKAFLLDGMSGAPVTVQVPKSPEYKPRTFGTN
jgi:cytochrome c peroxidase